MTGVAALFAAIVASASAETVIVGHPPKVVTQSPAAGKIRAPGTKVHLLLD